MNNESYDIIGDIHGEAAALCDLLSRLGYRERGGCYRHPRRRAIFLGDYVDRGPAIRETLHIIRAMVERGAAHALCGNHELDALLYATPDGRGGWLRPHSGRCSIMQAKTEAEFADRLDEWREWLRWFQSLPLFLELPGLRAVHACWDMKQVGLLGARRLDDSFLHEVADRKTPQAAAVHRLLKGPEVPLPTGVCMRGSQSNLLTDLRVRWWEDGRGKTYREACIHRHEPAPDLPIPPEYENLLTPPHDDRHPIFIGHYWLPPQRPTLLAPTVACLDFSVASGGPLVAYRWDGERFLQPEKFVFDPDRLREGTSTNPMLAASAGAANG